MFFLCMSNCTNLKRLQENYLTVVWALWGQVEEGMRTNNNASLFYLKHYEVNNFT